MIKTRPALFRWPHFEPQVIVCAVRWYLRFSLSYRDVEELLVERGLTADHTTIWRWVQRYAPELEQEMPPQTETDQRLLEGGRNGYLPGRKLAVPVSRRRFQRRYDRLLVLCGA